MIHATPMPSRRQGQTGLSCQGSTLRPCSDVEASTFTAAVQQSRSPPDVATVLTGVPLELAGTTLTMLATDRYRLAIRDWIGTSATRGADLVPARTLPDTAETPGPLGGAVTVAVSRAQVGNGCDVTIQM
jgi:DNA polymerase-3 subunit beta